MTTEDPTTTSQLRGGDEKEGCGERDTSGTLMGAGVTKPTELLIVTAAGGGGVGSLSASWPDKHEGGDENVNPAAGSPSATTPSSQVERNVWDN